MSKIINIFAKIAVIAMLFVSVTCVSVNATSDIRLPTVLKDTFVYEVSGPLFFGAADKILKIAVEEHHHCLILRMRSVSAIDATAMHNLEKLHKDCEKKHVHLIFSHVNEQPMKVMQKSGFVAKVGTENFCAHIDDALALAEKLQG